MILDRKLVKATHYIIYSDTRQCCVLLSAKHQRDCFVFIRIFSKEPSHISSDMKAILRLFTLCTLYCVFDTWARSVGGTGWVVCGLRFTYLMSGFGEVEGFIRVSTY